MSQRDFSLAFKEPAYIKLDSKKDIITNVEVLIGTIEKDELYLSKDFISNNSSWAYYMALEKITGMKISKKVNILRTISDEIVRASSHLFNMSILAHMVNSKFILSKTIRLRDAIQDIKKGCWNSKMDLDISILGNVKYDLDTFKIVKIFKKIEKLEPKIDELISLYKTDKNIIENTVGVGILRKEDALKYGAVGPVARGSGINNDIRINVPYGIYDEIKPKVIVKEEGDVFARLMVRCYEIKDSLRIVKEALDLLFENRLIIQKKPKFSNAESFARIEAPRGELFCSIKTDESGNILKNELRVPSHMNWEVFKVMTLGNKTEQVPLILNSIDPCLTM